MSHRTQLVIVGLLLALSFGRARGQEPRACPDGEPPRANLGIPEIVCHCSYETEGPGGGRRWDFDTEPRILGIEAGGPADGILREGDFVVAIDGRLITTDAGGRRWSTLEPGESVRLKVRRGDATREVEIRVGAWCRSDDAGTREPAGTSGSGREPAARSPLLPRGWLGLGLTCDCSVDTRSGLPLWTFVDAPRISAVAPGSPADRVGVGEGDVLLAVDGASLTTRSGAMAFSTLEPGRRVRLTIRRDGVDREVEVVAGERPR